MTITHPGQLINAALEANANLPRIEQPVAVVQTYALRDQGGGRFVTEKRHRVRASVTLAIKHSGRFAKEPPIYGGQTFSTLCSDPTFAAKVSEEFILNAALAWCASPNVAFGHWGLLNSASDALNIVLLRRRGIDVTPNNMLLNIGSYQTTDPATEDDHDPQ